MGNSVGGLGHVRRHNVTIVLHANTLRGGTKVTTNLRNPQNYAPETVPSFVGLTNKTSVVTSYYAYLVTTFWKSDDPHDILHLGGGEVPAGQS
jgi:hypothetical protein